MPQATFFDSTQSKPGKLLFSITIPGRLPSWNDILGMEQWARYKFKQELQKEFLSALRLSASDSSTLTTYAKNSMSIAADTLASYMETARLRRKLKSASGSVNQGKRSRPRLKSTSYKPEGPPPF